MAEATTPLAETIEEFEHARGDGMDGAWAHAVSWALMRRDVEPDLVSHGLQEALEVVRQTQEPPEDLFGTPDEHADALYEQWQSEGRLRLWEASRITWREVPSSGFAWSALIALVFMVLLLVDGETTTTWTLGRILLTAALGLGTAAAAAVWDTMVRRRGTAIAITGTGVTVLAMAAVTVGINKWSEEHPFATASTWWFLAVAGTCALLSTTWRRWLDSRPTPGLHPVVEAQEWSRQLAAILRGRLSMSDARVSAILAETQAHATEAGRSVQDEFGTPEEYAARFGPDLARRSRLTVVFYVLLSGLNIRPMLDEVTWVNVVLAVGFACLAVVELRRHARDEGTPERR